MIPALYGYGTFDKPKENEASVKPSRFNALPDELIREVFFQMNINCKQIFNKASSQWIREQRFEVCQKIKQSHLAKVLFPDLINDDFARDEKSAAKNLKFLNQKIKKLWGKFQDGELIYRKIQKKFGSSDARNTFESFDEHFNGMAIQVLELPRNTKYGYDLKKLFIISLLLFLVFAGLLIFAHIYISPILLLGVVFLAFGGMGAFYNRIKGEQHPELYHACKVEKALGRSIVDLQRDLLPSFFKTKRNE